MAALTVSDIKALIVAAEKVGLSFFELETTAEKIRFSFNPDSFEQEKLTKDGGGKDLQGSGPK